jgi:NADH:ubiquinone oxidoreductase subunit 5 (subunit L)/multisubunit Na+/H+ antiporter MnhA subunit
MKRSRCAVWQSNGRLAIAGIIPFSGFWSKDSILAKAWIQGDYGLWAVGTVAASSSQTAAA